MYFLIHATSNSNAMQPITLTLAFNSSIASAQCCQMHLFFRLPRTLAHCTRKRGCYVAFSSMKKTANKKHSVSDQSPTQLSVNSLAKPTDVFIISKEGRRCPCLVPAITPLLRLGIGEGGGGENPTISSCSVALQTLPTSSSLK